MLGRRSFTKMWHRRLRIFDIRHRCPWRKTLSIFSLLLLVNTAIQWSLVDDVGTSFGQPDHRKAVTRARGGDAASLHDRVISINKWFDGGIEEGGEERDLKFDVRGKRDDTRIKDEDKEPLITYITRKPSNRRPLGEAPVGTQRGSVANLVTNNTSINSSSLLLGNGRNAIKIKENVAESRQKLDAIREKILIRKREMIRNRSIDTRDIVITFLQKHQTKLRSLTKANNNLDYNQVKTNMRIFESKMNYVVVDIYSNDRVRYYSRPGWLDMRDIDAMNILAGSWIMQQKADRQQLALSNIDGTLVLISNNEFERLLHIDIHGKEMGESDLECSEKSHPGSVACQAAWCSADLALVVAFHLDRVIGVNVTPPTVGRELPGGTRHPTAMQHVGDATHPRDTRDMQARSRTLHFLENDLQVQTVSLILKSSMNLNSSRGERERPTETHIPVSGDQPLDVASEKLYIFCFLLKIANCSLDQWKDYFNTMGRHQRSIEVMNSSFPQTECAKQSPVQVFTTPSKPYQGEIDILWKLKRLSKDTASLLKAGRIRQRLLQSLFLDRVFWTEAGGRHGIEDILNVIDGRVKELSELLPLLPNILTER